jgi:adenylate cyclase class 2
MSVEIELKAWVDDPDRLRLRLFLFAGQGTSFEKADAYWVFPGECDAVLPSGVRLRKETRTAPSGEVSQVLWVTYKVKEVREGMEINDEREFSISDGAAFEELLRRLGLQKDIEKNKRGWAWICDGITAELTEVEGLGWFVELEIVTDTDTDGTVTAARTRLLALLRKIGIKKDRIEPRYYTEMLREKAGPGPFPLP